VGDEHRGSLLECMLTKIRFKTASVQEAATLSQQAGGAATPAPGRGGAPPSPGTGPSPTLGGNGGSSPFASTPGASGYNKYESQVGAAPAGRVCVWGGVHSPPVKMLAWCGVVAGQRAQRLRGESAPGLSPAPTPLGPAARRPRCKSWA
jgi:hypothetical protein